MESFSGLPKEALAELERLFAESPDGNLLPATVVDVARNPNSPLHKYFTWDDSTAAIERRIDQARSLIRRVRIRSYVADSKLFTPAYLSSPIRRHNGGGYRLASSLDRSDAIAVLLEIAACVGTELRKLNALGEVMDVTDIAKTLESAILQLRQQAAKRATSDERREGDKPAA